MGDDPFLTPYFRHSNVAMSMPDNQSASVIQIESSKLVPWLMLACLMAGLALGLTIANMTQQASLMDAKIDARIAKFDASALAARQDARIALDKVEQTQVQLGAAGLIKPSTH